MRKLKKFMLGFLLAAVLCMTAACGANGNGDSAGSKDNGTTQNGTAGGDDAADRNDNGTDAAGKDNGKVNDADMDNRTDNTDDGVVGDLGRDVVDGVEDLGDDVRDGAEDVGDAVRDNADNATNNGSSTDNRNTTP